MTREEVKESRRILGITQQELSNLLGVSLGTVQTWESGVRNIKKDTALQLQAFVDKHLESRDTIMVSESLTPYGSAVEKNIFDLISELRENENDPRWGRLELLVQQMANELKSKSDKLEVIQNITGSIAKIFK